jgi:hypothetical protein
VCNACCLGKHLRIVDVKILLHFLLPLIFVICHIKWFSLGILKLGLNLENFDLWRCLVLLFCVFSVNYKTVFLVLNVRMWDSAYFSGWNLFVFHLLRRLRAVENWSMRSLYSKNRHRCAIMLTLLSGLWRLTRSINVETLQIIMCHICKLGVTFVLSQITLFKF